MKIFKKGISYLLLAGLIWSCGDDDTLNPTGLSETILSSFSATASGDGTVITVKPVSIGASSFTVDFGDPNSTSDVLTISEQGGSVSYDYPNEVEKVTYTITVTSASDKGLSPKTITEQVTITHAVMSSISTVSASPGISNADMFALFSDGMDFDGGFLGYRWGEAASGGTAVKVGDNSLIQLSRLGSSAGVLSMKSVETSNTFGDGIAATHIHFDVHSDFSKGIDKLKIILKDGSDSFEIDGLDLSDGTWTAFDFELATDFSGAVMAIDKISFELGTGGTANDHASIHVDNIYLYKENGSTILNGDFEIEGTYATSQWRFATFTNGTTDPFGSSSDGSDFDIDGNDTGGKTRGAKWSSSQSAGQLASPNSRYAYQALTLTPNKDYVLQYQYALDDDNNEIIGGRNLSGLVLDGHFTDGADAVSDINNNLGNHVGYIAEGKFSDTPNDYGTFAQIPFTSTENGKVAVMFYSVSPDDVWIDNVRIIEAANVTPPTPMFSSEVSTESFLDYTFINTSTDAASFAWDFGDGNKSTEKSPTHTYAIKGNYNVVLTAKNSAGSIMENKTITVSAPSVPATFEAVILNGSIDEYNDQAVPPTPVGAHKDDNNDAWETDPPNTLKDGVTASPYTWENSGLKGLGLKAAGITTSVNTGNYALKYSSNDRRAYQPFTVEVGVEYTITMWVRTETTTDFNVYILNNEVQDELDLAGNSDKVFTVSGNTDTYTEYTFKFTASTTTAVFYGVPHAGIDGSSEVYLDDISIATPGF